MIQITSHMRILLATAPADFRNGIDGLAKRCRKVLNPIRFPVICLSFGTKALPRSKYWSMMGKASGFVKNGFPAANSSGGPKTTVAPAGWLRTNCSC